MTESTGEHVECPICGADFNPAAAGGWCTNPECGEWQYLGDEVPDPAEPADDEAATPHADGDETDDWTEAESADDWISPPGGGSDAESPDAATTESAGADAEADSSDDELTLEFGTAPGEESAADADADTDEAAEMDANDPDPEAADDPEVDPADAPEVDPADEPEVDGAESTEEPAADAETAACPDCGASVGADAKFCPACGADVAADAPAQAACPSCGADVEPGDAFCAACGADLDAADGPASDAPDRLALGARGQEVLVSPDQTVGREIRRIVTDTGGDEDDAVRIHREHVRFVRENGRFYVVDLGDNPTELNGSRLSKGDREPIEPGDELTLSDVVTLSVERP